MVDTFQVLHLQAKIEEGLLAYTTFTALITRNYVVEHAKEELIDGAIILCTLHSLLQRIEEYAVQLVDIMLLHGLVAFPAESAREVLCRSGADVTGLHLGEQVLDGTQHVKLLHRDLPGGLPIFLVI